MPSDSLALQSKETEAELALEKSGVCVYKYSIRTYNNVLTTYG